MLDAQKFRSKKPPMTNNPEQVCFEVQTPCTLSFGEVSIKIRIEGFERAEE